MTESKALIRCAVYTRKSSEEGLEQSFNSLDAQRESCQAFIASQRQEGWRLLPAHYDDGGFSGGTIKRPALKRLLEDVEAHKVDTIVVYKVDRLTRSLADFAKIVEALDARGVSFVSVTQQFNTTSSMGRLTLNVLLSFAQFEREVTGERIRDKIAASKRKGMWMGGTIPLGYDLKERKLIVNPKEEKFVVRVFNLYLELGCVSKLKIRLDQERVKSKVRISATGNRSGGASYSRGALYDILQNRIYLGEIHHKGENHVGEHTAIVPRELWHRVQGQLKRDNKTRSGMKTNSPSLLVGLLKDAAGNRLIPSHTSKNGRRYRYYASQGNTGGNKGLNKSIRVPANDIERQVAHRLQSFLQSGKTLMDELGQPGDTSSQMQQFVQTAAKQAEMLNSTASAEGKNLVRGVVRGVVVHPDRISVEVSRQKLYALLSDHPIGSNSTTSAGSEPSVTGAIRLEMKARIQRCGGGMRLILPSDFAGPVSEPSSSLLKAVARGREWYEWILTARVSSQRAIAQKLALSERYVGRILECAFLAPDIVEGILAGRQPSSLTFKKLTREVPSSWIEQRRQLGFPAVSQ
jgi:site-specific DNA recombinase